MIVSHEHWMWFCGGVTGIVAVAWLVLDGVRLGRALTGRGVDRDHLFGYVVGVVVGLIGIVGVARFHLLQGGG